MIVTQTFESTLQTTIGSETIIHFTYLSVIRANMTYFCVQWQGAGGRVAVIPLSQKGKLRVTIGRL